MSDSRAIAGNAGRFLREVVQRSSSRGAFPIRGIRLTAATNSWPGLPVVNKRACQDGTVRIWGIELDVLPPRRPQSNGCVERVNRTVREEFYSQYRGEVDLASVIKDWPNTSTNTITFVRTGRWV